MSQEPSPAPSALSIPAPLRPRLLSRWLSLVALALSIAVVGLAVVVGPAWISELSRDVRRMIIEYLLRLLKIAYAALFLTSLAATPLLVWLLARARHAWSTRPLRTRGFMLGVSSLCALALLEGGAAGWRAWMNRFPHLPSTFPPSSAEEFRIVVLGGSSALGEPYRPWLSVGQIVAWQLQQAAPKRRFECEILAWLGDTLEKQHHKLAALKRRPDAVIVYSGHNEFAARFGEEHESWSGELPGGSLLSSASCASSLSPFCNLVEKIINKNRIDTPPLGGRHQLIDPPLCSAAEYAEILDDFGRRLEAIVSYCEQIGALSILIIPPANEAGFEPSRSTLRRTVPRLERDRLVRELQEARDCETSDPAASESHYATILTRHPEFAEAHFRLGRLLEQSGQSGAAAEHFLAALDHDGLPVRCPAPFRAVYEQVARRHPGAILIDGRHELSASSPDGLLGDDLIQDTHHPTLLGQVVLAGAVLREIQRRQILALAGPIDLPLDPAACAEHFAMDAGKWATMCERTSEHYRRVAGYRYDPVERLQKARRYAKAAQQIRAGVAPDDLGLPGVGTRFVTQRRRQ